MTRLDAFDSFYRASNRQMLAISYALTGSRQDALPMTVEAYSRTWRQWNKLRGRDPAVYTRSELYKLVAVVNRTHILRRKSADEPDAELLEALSELDPLHRRLVTLLTIGSLNLEQAAKEAGLDDEDASKAVASALGTLESEHNIDLDAFEIRMQGLAEAAHEEHLPRPERLRHKARSEGRRNTTIVAVAAALITILGGMAATDGDSWQSAAQLPYREKLGAERPDIVLSSRQLDVDDLLSLDQVAQLDPEATWNIDGTNTDVTNNTPYSTCPTTRFADPDPLKVFVRAYSNSEATDRVAQSIEVSRSAAAAEAAHRQLVSWYANCEHPRVRLVDSYTVRRPFGDFQILRLQSLRSPERFISVGLAQSGVVTSTLVHEKSGVEPADVNVFAEALNDSIERVCADSGGECSSAGELLQAPPPRTDTDPSFLSVVDLPPLGSVDQVWEPGNAQQVASNPASSLCDKTEFGSDEDGSFVDPQSKLFLLPDAPGVPREFAIAQTVTATATTEEAEAVIDSIRARVEECTESELSATIEPLQAEDDGAVESYAWRIVFEVGEDEIVTYRMGIVRRHNTISQVLFPPAGDHVLAPDEFVSVLDRAGERLLYSEALNPTTPAPP